MAAFDEQDFHKRLDWELLQNGWITLYKKPAILENDIKWLEEHDYTIYRFSCDQWSSTKVALKDLGLKLNFPDYYGQNFDALNDCLGDIDVPMHGGAAIVLGRYEQFAEADPETANAILDIIADRARMHMLFGKRLVTLVQSDDPRLSFGPLGSTRARWNRKETLHKNRQ